MVINYSAFCDAGMICLGGRFYFPATKDDPRAIEVSAQLVRPATEFELFKCRPTVTGAIPPNFFFTP